jgi:HJR/Mrr/RecB family endonuclease
VVTNSKFTKYAIDLAKSNNIKLISRTELKKWLKI